MKAPAVLAVLLLFGGALAVNTATVSAMTATQMSEVQHLQATAKAAQTAIQSSSQDLKAITGAIQVRDVVQARAILLKHGFTATQLESGVMVFSHQLLPAKIKPSEFYYFLLGNSPLKIEVHALPSR
jgi:hypothetical protein